MTYPGIGRVVSLAISLICATAPITAHAQTLVPKSSDFRKMSPLFNQIGDALDRGIESDTEAKAISFFERKIDYSKLDSLLRSAERVTNRASVTSLRARARSARRQGAPIVAAANGAAGQALQCGSVCAYAAAWAAASCYARACAKCPLNPFDKPICFWASARAYAVAHARICVRGCARSAPAIQCVLSGVVL